MRTLALVFLVVGCGNDVASTPQNYYDTVRESDSLVFSAPIPESLAKHDPVPYAVRASCRTAAGMKDCLIGARLGLRPEEATVAPLDATVGTMISIAERTTATSFPALGAKSLLNDPSFAAGLGEQELVKLLAAFASQETELYHGFDDIPLGYEYRTRVRDVVGKFEVRIAVKRGHADSDEVQSEEHNGTFELHGGGPLDLKLGNVECVDTYYKTTYDVTLRFFTKAGELVSTYAVKDAAKPDCKSDGATYFVGLAPQ